MNYSYGRRLFGDLVVLIYLIDSVLLIKSRVENPDAGK